MQVETSDINYTVEEYIQYELKSEPSLQYSIIIEPETTLITSAKKMKTENGQQQNIQGRKTWYNSMH